MYAMQYSTGLGLTSKVGLSRLTKLKDLIMEQD